MNEKQLAKIEGAIMAALTYLQCHATDQAPETGYDHVIDELRGALSLMKVWKALSRGLGHAQTDGELPGQMTIPGVTPGDTDK